MQVKTNFIGLLNSDAAPHMLQPTEYVNLENLRIGETTDKGRTLQLESIGANVEIPNSYLPAGTNITIGSCEDEARQRFFKFNYNSNGDHAIYCTDGTTVYKVLLDSQVEGGLNFDKDRLIHSAKVVGNLLIWTDGNNEPKCINAEAGIKLNHSDYTTDEVAYVTPVKYTTTTLIKRPPIFPVTWQKIFDGTFSNNFIADAVFQPTYRYRYRDGQVSALASYGKVIPYNADAVIEADNFNRVDFTIPVTEYIDDDIFAIDLCVKFGNYGKTFIIKSWDKDSDAAEIAAHNSGTPLSFQFFNDINGEVLDDVVANTSFDSVPLLSGTLEVADNRVFLGKNRFGYNTPFATSLSLAVGNYDTGGAGTFTVAWKYIEIPYSTIGSGGGIVGDSQFYYAYYSDGGLYTAYFWDSHKDETTSPSGTLDASTATTRWNTEANLMQWIKLNYSPPAGNEWEIGGTVNYFDTGFTTSLLIPADAGTNQFFKSNSTYKVSIAFYDRFRRKCGLVKNYKQVTIPVRTYDQSVFSATVDWALSNTDALTEIPDWAYYYQIHITRNQTTRFFAQINSPKSSYVTRSVDGALTYNQTTFAINTNYATSFDLTQLISNGLGYTFADGDLLIVYKSDGSSRTIPILGMDGSNVLCKPTDIGDLTSTEAFLIEIYTPYKTNFIEPYYETGSVYPVINPGTSGRAYSSLTGEINGDCYSIMRDKGGSDLYFCEVMSPNDKFWKDWETDTGWPNVVDPIGQKDIGGSIAFSDTFIEGSKVNGINKFQPLNVVTVPSQNGAVTKLKLTSKTQAEGQVMLAICQFETMSIYLGEAILTSATGENTAIATSNGVIGTMNTLKGSYGTTNPESVVAYRGNVYWFDAKSGDFVFYSVNGVHSVTEGKASRFAKLFSDAYKSQTSAAIEALGNRPFVIGGVDPKHKEILWSIPKTGDNPNGTLADTDDNIDYPYDFWDAQGKTIVLKLSGNSEAMMGSQTYNAEDFCTIGNNLYSFKNGKIYLHNQTSAYNTFYGVPVKARVMFAVNAEPSMPKVLAGIVVESNVCPSYIHFRSEYPNIQSSDLVSSDFTAKEGVFYAAALRDRLSPNVTGDANRKLSIGDRLRGTYIYQLIEFHKNDGIVQLKATNTAFIDSRGQRV